MRHRVLAAVSSAALFAFASWPAMAQPAMPDAAALQARMTAATGPANDNYSDTFVGTSDAGQTTTMEYFRGKDHLIVVSRGPVIVMSGTYHGADWNRDANGITVADDPAPGLVAIAQPKTTVQHVTAPADAYVLSVLDANGFGTRDTIDPATFLVKRHEAITNSGTLTTIYTRYAQFGTQTLPAAWTFENPNLKYSVSYSRSQFVAGKTSEDDIAVPPVHQVTILPANAASVDVHGEFNQTMPAIPVTIGGKRLFFEIESSTPDIEIDAAVAQQLGLPTDSAGGAGAPRADAVTSTVIPTIDINGVHMHDVVASVVHMGSGRTASDPAGVLGFDFFAELAVHIDYKHEQISVSDPRRFQPPATTVAAAIPVRLGDRIPLITMTMDGASSERIAVSTGTNYELLIFPTFAVHHPDLVRDRHDSSIYSINVPDRPYGTNPYGVFNARDGTVALTKLGPFTIHNTDASVGVSRRPFSTDVDGVIGSPFLEVFSVDFDYATGRIYLTPNPADKKR